MDYLLGCKEDKDMFDIKFRSFVESLLGRFNHLVVRFIIESCELFLKKCLK